MSWNYFNRGMILTDTSPGSSSDMPTCYIKIPKRKRMNISAVLKKKTTKLNKTKQTTPQSKQTNNTPSVLINLAPKTAN